MKMSCQKCMLNIQMIFFFEYIDCCLITKATVQGLIRLCIKCKTPLLNQIFASLKEVSYLPLFKKSVRMPFEHLQGNFMVPFFWVWYLQVYNLLDYQNIIFDGFIFTLRSIKFRTESGLRVRGAEFSLMGMSRFSSTSLSGFFSIETSRVSLIGISRFSSILIADNVAELVLASKSFQTFLLKKLSMIVDFFRIYK